MSRDQFHQGVCRASAGSSRTICRQAAAPLLDGKRRKVGASRRRLPPHGQLPRTTFLRMFFLRCPHLSSMGSVAKSGPAGGACRRAASCRGPSTRPVSHLASSGGGPPARPPEGVGRCGGSSAWKPDPSRVSFSSSLDSSSR